MSAGPGDGPPVPGLAGLTLAEFWEPPMFDHGSWLTQRRAVMDRNEAAWLEVLADFDQDEGWALDGQLSCGAWLVYRCGMGRSTAYEKVRVARELRRRPAVREALAAGEISYSAARLITAIEGAEPDLDETLLELARSKAVSELEQAVRYYQAQAGQYRGKRFLRPEYREVHIYKGFHGYGELRAVLPNEELEEIEVMMRAFGTEAEGREPESARADSGAGVGTEGSEPESARADSTGAGAGVEAEGTESQSARADSGAGADAPGGSAGIRESEADRDDEVVPEGGWLYRWHETRADAFMDAVAVALAHRHDGHGGGADRYLVHLVSDVEGAAGKETGRSELVDGSQVSPAAAARIVCDCSFVAHLVGAGSEPLYLGRKVRNWSAGQRRAIRVRDRGRCRFPGCRRSLNDIHHILPWTEGGSTDVSNGILLCARHHTLAHGGFRAEGDANDRVVFHRPDGSVLGSSRPSISESRLFRAA